VFVNPFATLALLVAFGALTGLDGPRIAANLPTPWVGVWERINIGAFLFWVVVLAVALLRAKRTTGMVDFGYPDGVPGRSDGSTGSRATTPSSTTRGSWRCSSACSGRRCSRTRAC
jgi:hypothetical protein